MNRFSVIVCSSVKTAASIRLFGLPVFFNQRLNNAIALVGPSASPSTVPLSVFLTHPDNKSSCALTLVNLRKYTPCTFPDISKWTNEEEDEVEAAEDADDEEIGTGTATVPFRVVLIFM